jgi:hypothetical protein
MQTKRLISLGVLIVAAVGGCANSTQIESRKGASSALQERKSDRFRPVVRTVGATPADEVRRCEQNGGKIERRSLGQRFEVCVVPFRDAGSRCTDNSQCEGACIADAVSRTRVASTGRCQADNDPYGCFSELVNGKTDELVCVD